MRPHAIRAAGPAEGGRPHHRADIQGLRGLAVLLVVGYHVRDVVPGGFVGVDVFFVVSGFVITTMLRAQMSSSGSISVRRFFARRVRRLLPMLAITLSVTSVLGVLLLSPLGASAVTSRTAIAAALLNANTFLARQSQDYFALPADANALLHTWSLSVEEQFYLVLPFALLAGLALGRRFTPSLRQPAGAAAVVSLAVLGLLSYGSFAVLAAGGLERLTTSLGLSSTASVAFYSAPSRAWEFIAGSLLAFAGPVLARRPATLRAMLGLVGLAAIASAAFTFTEASGRSATLMLIPVVGAVLLIGAGTAGDTFAGNLLSIRPLTALGDVSYGWYLFHWPLIVFAEANVESAWGPLVAAAVSLLLAFMAKGAVEDRFRYDDRWRGARAAKLAAGCVALPVLAGLASVAADDVLSMDELEATAERHIDSDGCNRRFDEWVLVDDPACTWTVRDPVGSIVLVGDSHASMWAEATIAAGNELGYDVSIVTMSGCPMVAGTVRISDGELDRECQRFIEQYVGEIRSLRPDAVVFGAGSTGVLGAEGGDPWLNADGNRTNNPDEVIEIWESGLGDTVAALADGGILSILMHDVPYHEYTTAACSRLRFLIDEAGCASTRTRRDVEADRLESLAVEDRLDASADFVVSIDPVPWLCSERECSTNRSGTWMYRDGDHLSVAASTVLADEFRRALEGAGL